MIIRKYVHPWIFTHLFIDHENFEAMRLFWSRGPDSYRKNDRKRAVVWPWLVLQLTVLALTQLGIRQSDWRRAGIRSTNLHIVVEYVIYHWSLCWLVVFHASVTSRLHTSYVVMFLCFDLLNQTFLMDMSDLFTHIPHGYCTGTVPSLYHSTSEVKIFAHWILRRMCHWIESSLVPIMAWHLVGTQPLSEAMLA